MEVERARDLDIALVEERSRVASLERSLEATRQNLAQLQATCARQETELSEATARNQEVLDQWVFCFCRKHYLV